MAAAASRPGTRKHLYLGNLDAVRDWGYAKEYVEGMWRMLQRDEPDDYVLATGTPYSVRDFLRFCFEAVDLDWDKYVDSTRGISADRGGRVDRRRIEGTSGVGLEGNGPHSGPCASDDRGRRQRDGHSRTVGLLVRLDLSGPSGAGHWRSFQVTRRSGAVRLS